jgi:hypothetical protein
LEDWIILDASSTDRGSAPVHQGQNRSTWIEEALTIYGKRDYQ